MELACLCKTSSSAIWRKSCFLCEARDAEICLKRAEHDEKVSGGSKRRYWVQSWSRRAKRDRTKIAQSASCLAAPSVLRLQAFDASDLRRHTSFHLIPGCACRQLHLPYFISRSVAAFLLEDDRRSSTCAHHGFQLNATHVITVCLTDQQTQKLSSVTFASHADETFERNAARWGTQHRACRSPGIVVIPVHER